MPIVITGADGFIGKNLQLRLAELGHADVVGITRATPQQAMQQALAAASFVFHLAGINRPQDPAEFVTGNAGLTHTVCEALTAAKNRVPMLLASSMQAMQDNPYGRSKLAAEGAVRDYGAATGAAVHVFRLPNVFGKWCKPNYNSAVATFCHNIARSLPIQVNDPSAPVTLVYVDDVIERFVQLMDGADAALDGDGFSTVTPQYTTTVGELARQIQAFKDSRTTLVTERVGTGLIRALYATYVSYLPPELFAYPVQQHTDPRGTFVEMLKTPDCGQFSYFTAHPGITRGGHYHHSKTEKFLVIKGRALFKFRHMQTGQQHALETNGDQAVVVETVPGWTHDITNIGADEMVVMLWANEVFDRARPDTFSCTV
ncbi:capsular polysaccharide biosynthesis protein CapF [Rhodoferax sp. PAMC 29310]|uniref:UDP-2-acetamido-2,6-beta-L-arabino-hexul-4-ose reductase n=1 Tax=Rhodoferax sp. PAMC 29310 TaxID=2822760 RepID=UPI001B33CF36|nr:capsular polysaccharide biosynthesis protein CapF [Rhodoferax sp. PAMC 29310]